MIKLNLNQKKDEINNLKKDSIVKIDTVYKLHDKQILFKIGEIDRDRIEEYKKSFYKILEDDIENN